MLFLKLLLKLEQHLAWKVYFPEVLLDYVIFYVLDVTSLFSTAYCNGAILSGSLLPSGPSKESFRISPDKIFPPFVKQENSGSKSHREEPVRYWNR
jgi:hypothetical protein